MTIGALLLLVAQLGMRWEDRRDRRRMDEYRLGRVKEESGIGESCGSMGHSPERIEADQGTPGQGRMMLDKGNGEGLSDV